jgi:hypothetical protein
MTIWKWSEIQFMGDSVARGDNGRRAAEDYCSPLEMLPRIWVSDLMFSIL